jgi:hypothetical protein
VVIDLHRVWVVGGGCGRGWGGCRFGGLVMLGCWLQCLFNAKKNNNNNNKK